MHISAIVLAACAALAVADPFDLPSDFDRYAPLKDPPYTIGACTDDPKKQCGRLEVHLDRSNEKAGKTSLAVAIYAATGPSDLFKGVLLLNPGGPGGSGVDLVLGGYGDMIMNELQGSYTLISWDPRGVGRSYPLVNCFKDGKEERSFWHGTVPDAGLEARGDFTDDEDIKNFYSQEPEVDRLLKELSQRCSKLSPDFLQYVGTDAAVDDMLSLKAHFSPAGHYLVNYWGFSYGTAIGAYFVNMFPEYVGRVILDGVVDPVYWANKPAYEIWSINVESTDKGLTGFIEACGKAGPSSCAFAEGGPSDLGKKIHEMLDLAYDYKKHKKGKFGSAYIRNILFHGMYSPAGWLDLAKSLQACWDFLNNKPGSELEYCFNPTPPTTPNDYSFQAITCADAADSANVTTKMVFQELVNVTRDVSHTFGPSWGIGGLYCHRWPVRSAHRYQGPWNKKSLRSKILVIGNDGDPVTPLRSAKSVASALGDSAVLIEQDSFGHSSLAMHSKCTWDAIRDYFLDKPFTMIGRVCKADQTIFPGVTMSMVTSLVTNSSSDPNPANLGGNSPDTQVRFP